MGIRTPGLLIANETLYQLSYTPESEPGKMPQAPREIKPRIAGQRVRIRA